MRHVVVSAERSAKWWMLTCDEGSAQGRCKRLEQAAEKLRDQIAENLGVHPESFVVDVEILLPSSFHELVRVAEQYEAAASVAHRAATDARREAARTLAAEQLSVRDIGETMGVSHQSVYRMLAPSAPAKPAAPTD